MEQTDLTTDVLVIGGGVAGLNAGLSALAAGARVTIMDKAVIARSGHAAGGIDHFLAFLETGPDWDTREAYLDFTVRASKGATRPEVAEQAYCEVLPAAMARFEEIGVSLRQADGSYLRTRSFGQPGPWWVNFNGKRLKPALARAVRQAGAQVLDRVALADLLVEDGRVWGATGFHIREGTFFILSAKAVILATGGTNRLFTHPSGLSFNTWMCPADTGDGEAAAFRAGAALANVEYLRMTVVPRGFSAPGLNALVGMGARLVNGLGREFMESYHPQGMKGPRAKLAEGVIGELKAHRGPVYMDCRHLDKNDLDHLVTTLSYDKDTFGDFLDQKGIDLGQDLLEVAPSEGMQGGPNEVCGSGIRIDQSCAATVPGLFAAGNSADQCRSLHMAVTSGMHSGRMAAELAAKTPEVPTPPSAQVRAARERLRRPMESQGGTSWQEFELVLQRIITEGLGPDRTAWGFEQAVSRLDRLEAWQDQVRCPTYHDLCRFQELLNIKTVARCMLAAADLRKESRFGLGHNRLDHPRTDDSNWLGQIKVFQGQGGQPETEFQPLSYPEPGSKEA